MQQTETIWSQTEQKIAHDAFAKAYERETSTLINYIRSEASQVSQLEEIWDLHDFLSARRHQIDGKYDYRYSVLIFVFAQLVKEGWLYLEDLEGLDQDKLAKIAALTKM